MERHTFLRANCNAGIEPQEGSMMMKIIAVLKNESGATAIEYGMIAAGISVAIIAVVNGLGTQLNSTFSTISNAIAAQ
jgi:pilus assembly protein Flp/PilA